MTGEVTVVSCFIRVKSATRTRTDRHGRRHSVAVPLVPPPDGEKFEGGYYVERNPITGGAKLVTPSGGKMGAKLMWDHTESTYVYVLGEFGRENREGKLDF